MIKIILVNLIALLFFCLSAYADQTSFVGEWEIQLAPGTEAIRVGEIKYPRWLKISQKKGKLSVEYRDQYESICKLNHFMLINNGEDLIFPSCGTTKHPESYAPIHHVKRIDGKLHGIVTTSDKLFEWDGERKEVKKEKVIAPNF